MPTAYPEMSFTEARLKAIRPPASGRAWHRDCASPLLLMVTPSGAASFYVRRRVNGKPRTIRLASWPDVTVEAARKLARQTTAEIGMGSDPVEEKRKAKPERQRQGFTFGQTAEDFYEARQARGRIKPATLKEYRRLVDKHLDGWKPMPVGDITRAAAVALHAKLGKGHGPAIANNVMRRARSIFNHAVDMERLTASPLAGFKRFWFDSNTRSGRIADADLRGWFDAVEAYRLAPERTGSEIVRADALEMIALTGLRKMEALTLRWENVTDNSFSVPTTKSGRPLRLPVTPAVQAILDRRKAGRRPGCPWVFPAAPTLDGDNGHAVAAIKVIQRINKVAGVSVTIHDLRRTWVSVATPIIPGPVVKRIVNHGATRTGDVTADAYERMEDEQLRPFLDRVQREMLRDRTTPADTPAPFPRMAVAG